MYCTRVGRSWLRKINSRPPRRARVYVTQRSSRPELSDLQYNFLYKSLLYGLSLSPSAVHRLKGVVIPRSAVNHVNFPTCLRARLLAKENYKTAEFSSKRDFLHSLFCFSTVFRFTSLMLSFVRGIHLLDLRILK